MRPPFIQIGNKQWLKKWLLSILPRTWDLVTLLAGKFPIGCRWVYIDKIGSYGQVGCLKVHLIAKRYTHIYGFNYYGTFSPLMHSSYVS